MNEKSFNLPGNSIEGFISYMSSIEPSIVSLVDSFYIENKTKKEINPLLSLLDKKNPKLYNIIEEKNFKKDKIEYLSARSLEKILNTNKINPTFLYDGVRDIDFTENSSSKSINDCFLMDSFREIDFGSKKISKIPVLDQNLISLVAKLFGGIYDPSKINYDVGLKHRLGATNPYSDVALNIHFSKWADHIAENVQVRLPSGGSTYKSGVDVALLQKCREHAKAYEKPKTATKTVVMTHPLYLNLTHMHVLETDERKEEVSNYIDNLLEFMASCKERDDVNFVLLETVHHYAAATSLLVEKGFVDQVIFTHYDSGVVLNPVDLMPYNRDEIFIGGGYANRCLASSINCFNRYTNANVSGIKDLSLKSPQDTSGSLRCNSLVEISSYNMLTLDETMAALGVRNIYIKASPVFTNGYVI